ncbi:GNAT family N-acetyltransferase [Lentzea albida]|uniref:FR47-like protein n=1 Tax=Lentzea albida TaxID=65499 RepID=A0A1H9RIY6_9PSEU|nr:GNAT family N-acetyltransferase [Lentzea albida]SER72750.1 FR47-like protein [Lentzea albida]
MHPLDDPARSALTGPHARFAEHKGTVLRYPSDMSPFIAMPPDPTDADWLTLAALDPRPTVTGLEPPDGWQVEARLSLRQYVGEDVAAAPEPEAVRLSTSDVPEMIALVELTKPGPFLPRTIEMGTYLGIRREGRLVAMAGERLHVPGHTEISAVCTHPDAAGQALGTRLLLAVAHGIRERGETPFLHVLTSNTGAVRLYERLGFRLRLETELLVLNPGT